MDYRAAFWSLFAGCALMTALGFVVLPEMLVSEFDRGVVAGQQTRKPAERPNCLAWWFGGNPTLADRHLQAACAARKDHQ